MPRDSGGTFTLVAGNPVAPGTTIAAAWANDTMDDVAQGLTDSLDRNGRGGMLVAFLNADGLINAPGISWTNEPSSGWYRASAADFRYSVLGADVLRINAGQLFVWDGVDTWNAVIVEGGGGTILWGDIGGDIVNQADLQSALDTAGVTGQWGAITGTLADQTDLQSALNTKLEGLFQDPTPVLANILDIGPYGLGLSFTTSIGNAFAVGDVGYVNAAGTVSLAQADAEATTKGELVMSLAVTAGDAVGAFMSVGSVPGLTGLTGGSTYYLSAATAGKITAIPPATTGQFVRVIGYTGNSTTEIEFRVDGTWIKLA